MLRLLLSVLLLTFPAALYAQEEQDPVVITGVVQKLGFIDYPWEEGDKHKQPIDLVAWRQGDGPLQETVLRVHIAARTLPQLEALQEKFPERELVRIAIDGSLFEPETAGADWAAEANLLEVLEPGDDAEVIAAGNLIFNPAPISDPELGLFEPDTEQYEVFSQWRDWDGAEVRLELVLERGLPSAKEGTLSLIRNVLQNREQIDADRREGAAR